VWVKSHHTEEEEKEIENDTLRYWDRHLQIISDDADAETSERNHMPHEHPDKSHVAGRWQAMG